ncbi:MAG: hypothetical protein IKT40_11950 [Bacilli bacterium]|nr:hypothetical protein [Bacilli bacterium]
MSEDSNSSYFKEQWVGNFERAEVFSILRSTLLIAKNNPNSGFQEIWERFDKQLKEFHKLEFNNHYNFEIKPYNDIREVYLEDLDMIYRLTDFLHNTWPDLYTKSLVDDINHYVKQYEKYVSDIF